MNIGFDHLVVWSAVIEIFLGRKIGLANFSRVVLVLRRIFMILILNDGEYKLSIISRLIQLEVFSMDGPHIFMS